MHDTGICLTNVTISYDKINYNILEMLAILKDFPYFSIYT